MVNAVISEFNPFHNGHKYLLTQAQKTTGAEFTVCFMSGDFVQRGDIAYASKHIRAAAACRHGADIVFALPTAYSLASAGVFANAGVFCANALGVDTTLCFGSEDADISALFELAKIPADKLSKAFKAELLKGVSYGLALTKAYSAFGVDASILTSPNNLLAFEYIKAHVNQNTNLKIANIKRIGNDHDSQVAGDGFASASFIRDNNDIDHLKYMPQKIEPQINRDKFNDLLMYSIFSKTPEQLLQFADMNEGIENRFAKASKSAKTPSELFELVKSKRYTHAKIRRAAMSVLLQNPKGLCKQNVPYLKVLAFNDNGRKLLKIFEKTCTLPIVTKASQGRDINEQHFELDSRAADVFAYCSNSPLGTEFTRSPIYVK